MGILEKYVRGFFSEGHSRTIKAKRNIAALFILRGITIAVNFVLVPMTLNYLNPSRYGLWLTLSSTLTWVGFLDIGLGNGLRNKIAEAIAKSDERLAREYVSTTYASVALIAGIFLLLFWAVNPFLPWAKILASPVDMEPELRGLAFVVMTFFCLRLVFGLIGTILIANQRPAISSGLDVLISLLSLLAVFLLQLTTDGSLYLLGLCMSAISALVPFAASFWFFGRRYRRYRPTLRSVDFGHSRNLMSLGVQFFFLQLAVLVTFTTPNLIITQLFGSVEVATYNIAMKYYGIATMAFTIILAPFWSAYTDAYTRGDLPWIGRTIKKLQKLWLGVVVGVALMTFVADRMYSLWVGSSIQIPFLLSGVMGAYVLVFTWGSIYTNFINGTGKIRLQLVHAIITSITIVPLAIFLATRGQLGSTGVILATCILLLPGCFLMYLQTGKILGGTATGIWAK